MEHMNLECPHCHEEADRIHYIQTDECSECGKELPEYVPMPPEKEEEIDFNDFDL